MVIVYDHLLPFLPHIVHNNLIRLRLLVVQVFEVYPHGDVYKVDSIKKVGLPSI